MARCLYNSTIREFLQLSPESLLGHFVNNYHGVALTTTNEAWNNEIHIMQEILQPWMDEDGQVIFEYDIPRLGKRIDVVLLLRGLIFCFEFKVGEREMLQSNIEQVLDYALDLKNFHLLSQDRIIVPILVPTQFRTSSSEFIPPVYDDSIYNPLVTGANGLQKLIADVLAHAGTTAPDPSLGADWVISPYSPTPTIIEAAKRLYENHSVEDITRHEADKVSTDRTIAYILDVIKTSREKGEKSICFVTGVPGAGKTLVGLDVAVKQSYQNGDKLVEDEGAVYLSGNGPLVAVLTEALAIDNQKKCKARGEKKNMSDSRREVGKFIQMIHRYRDNMLAKIKNPVENGVLEIDPQKAMKLARSGYGEVEHVAIFDEAQRSWTHKRLADYLKRGGTYGNKLKVPNFPYSEAAFLIWSLDQREDWATIVCLVGGGQEINTGEAGLPEWFDSLRRAFPDWDVYITPQLNDDEYRRGRGWSSMLDGLRTFERDELHLATSVRSFRTPDLAAFVKAVLDAETDEAKVLYQRIKDKYPIVITRDLNKAKEWVRDHCQGTTRYGLLASSGALRLKPEGIFVKNEISVANWFLNGKDDVRSSYMLEDVVTEFDIQGLELDYSVVTWDADYRYVDGEWTYNNFVGNRWNNVSSEERRLYLKNAYRVLLTRARQGMAIFVPAGSDDDQTRKREWYDGIYGYLKEIGILHI